MITPNIHLQMLAAGVEVAHHESDLYALVTPESAANVAAYQFAGNVTRFREDDDTRRRQWFDIPFAYDPGAAVAQ
jgi:hypothetical protein